MKFDALQGDFSAGELSPKFKGMVNSDIYKAALDRMANTMPTRGKSVESRSGGNFLADPLLAQNPVAHFPVHDSPDGDFVVEVGLDNIRLMDKFGVKPWVYSFDPTQFVGSGVGADVDVWTDAKSRTVYLNHSDLSGTARIVDMGNVFVPIGLPTVTDESWDLTYNLAGDSVTLRVTNVVTGSFADYPLTRGAGNVNFGVIDAGHSEFNLQLISGTGAVLASSLWGLKLTKNGTQVANGSSPFTSLLTVRASPGFWTSDGKFYVLFVGGGAGDVYALRHTPLFDSAVWNQNTVYPVGTVVNNNDNLYLQTTKLSGTSAAAGTGPAGQGSAIADNTCVWAFYGVSDGWDFNPLDYYNSDTSFDKTKISTVAVYQSRVWLGTNDSQATLYATMSGYGITSARDKYAGPGLSTVKPDSKFTFRFGAATVRHTGQGAGFYIYEFDFSLPYDPTADAGRLLTVTVDGVPKTAGVDFGTGVFYNATDNAYSGEIGFLVGHEPPNGSKVVISRTVPVATDPLSLKLASPTARLAWMAILRGLVLGSVRSEKTIPAETLSLDPATGVAPNLLDHSSVGSDEALPALSVNEKIVYIQRGRKILRQASVRMNWEAGEPQSGLISEDAGVLGEHLMAAQVRSFCFLKGPVPRVVLAFDDGTGAIATLGGAAGMAWSRFTVPTRFGGIYSVAALDSTEDSQLWVGTENGVTLFFDTFESDVKHKYKLVPQASPASPARVLYDDETPLPPVMDGWTRVACFVSGNDLALSGVAGGAGVTGRNPISASLLGQQVYILSAGQVFGPFTVTTAGGRYFAQNAVLQNLGAFGFTWTDAAGNRRPQEVYVGLAYPEHRFTTLPLEGGNPAGTSQAYTSRRVQCYLRFVDSYMPLVGMERSPERGPADAFDSLGGRITGDRRITQFDFERGATLDVVMDLPLRVEVSAIFGGTQMQSS